MSVIESDKFRYFQRIEGMPIPPVRENMEVFHAGKISIGVEFRVLNAAVMDGLGIAERATANGLKAIDEIGVSFHVFVKTEEGDYERLRFDCFRDLPHYHYFSLQKKVQDTVYIDTNLTGDTVAWTLEVIRRRLPQMLARADVENACKLVNVEELEDVLPRVTEAAYRALFHTDKGRQKQIEKSAAAQGPLYAAGNEDSWSRHAQL